MAKGSAQNTDRGSNNVFISSSSGNFTTTANRTTGAGNTSLVNLTSGSDNTCFGYVTGQSYTTASRNVAVGGLAHTDAIASTECTSVGYLALTTATGGNFNTAIGSTALGTLVTGANCIGIGYQAGNSYTGSESSNICIGNTGTAAESNICRIGTTGSGTGQQTDSYIAGNVRAGTKFIFPSQTTIYVNAQTGNDTTGDGSSIYPYATITFANSVITDNTTSKRYCIRLSGLATEAAVTIKPFVSYVGDDLTTSRISVSGGSHNITLDSSWNGVTGGRSLIKNIGLFSATNISFSLSGFTGTGSFIYFQDFFVSNGTFSGTGRSTITDFLIFENCEISGVTTLTDIGVQSTANIYDSSLSFVSTNATTTRNMSSQADVYSGNVSCSETSTKTTNLIITNSSVNGSVTVTGATSVFAYDADSYPFGGVTLVTGGTASPLLVPLASGGTNASLTASNGGIFYSTASAGAILSGTATANQVLLSGASTTPAWSTATYPATTTVNQLLYSSSANVVAGLATGNSGVLITSAGGVPSISSTLPTTVQGNITSTGTLGATTFSGLITATAGGIQSWSPIGANTYTNTTYTFALTDQDTYIRFSNASAQTVTVPTNASVAFPIGTEINGIQAGAGQVTFAAAGGVTINSKGAVLSISGQYGGFSLKKYGSDTWDLIVG